MASNYESDSGSEFEGFSVEEVRQAEENLNRYEDEYVGNVSDVEISSESEYESDNETQISDDENEQHVGENWSSDFNPIVLEDFLGNPGPSNILENMANELNFFYQTFPEELYEFIADQTNLYADKIQQEKGVDKSWRRTSKEEIRAYIGAQILMGIVIAPSQDMYFTNDNLFRPSGLHERFSRDRLDKLHQYFHVGDNSTNPPRGQAGHDKLAHVRDVMTIILSKIKGAYRPHRESSIDEAMVGFTGRLGFKQYVPLKPTKRGIKVWMRADPHNGYVNEFQVYMGKEGVAERGLGERVVLDISRAIAGNYHHIYCDNYFTSVQLFRDLFEQQTYACGTIRTNRKGLPVAVSKSKLKKQGDCIQKQCDQLVATAWHDKRTVTLLATNADPTVMTEVSRKQKNGEVINVPCPVVVVKQYTAYMNGVDRADQLRSSYNICRKSLKWWKYLFWFMVDVCICNAFILMRESPNHQIRTKTGRIRERTQLEFRTKLTHQLLAGYWGKRKSKSVGDLQTEGLFHWPTDMDKKRTCKWCSKKKIRREPKTGCEQCQVNLCVPCFKPFHKDKHPEMFK
jgi:hypothetical protein